MADKFRASVILEAEDRASGDVRKAQNSFQRFGEFLRRSFVVTLGDITRIAARLGSALRESLTLQDQERALRRQLNAIGVGFDGFIGKLREVSDSTVSTADLIKASSSALLLGIPVDKISELLEVARTSAVATGQSVAQAFDDIATGIGRQSPLILDNLGITVRLTEAQEKYARELGKTVADLTDVEKKTALLNEVLVIGKKRTEEFGDAQTKAATAVQKASAEIDNLRVRLAKIGTIVVASLVVPLTRATNVMVRLVQGVTLAIGSLARLVASVGIFEERATKLADGLSGVRARLDEVGDSASRFEATMIDAVRELASAPEEVDATARSLQNLGGALDAAKESAEETKEEAEELGDGFDDLGLGADGARSSIRELDSNLDLLGSRLNAVRENAIRTTREFDALAESAGRAAAVSAGVAGGGELILGGTRIRLPGGGSRLTSSPTGNESRFFSNLTTII